MAWCHSTLALVRKCFPWADNAFRATHRSSLDEICGLTHNQSLSEDTTNQKCLTGHRAKRILTSPTRGQPTALEFLFIGPAEPRSSADVSVGKQPIDKNIVGNNDHPLFACSMRLNGKIAVITGASSGIDRVTEIIPMTARGGLPRPNRALLRQVALFGEGTFWQVTGRYR